MRSSTPAIAVAGTLYFATAVAVLHPLRPDLSPVHRPTSAYAVGDYGILMTSAFIALSIATWALSAALLKEFPDERVGRIGARILWIFATGLLVAATFPIELPGPPRTLAGRIHVTSGPLTFLSLVLAANLVSLGFKYHPQWEPIRRAAAVLALLMIPLFVAGGIAVRRQAGIGVVQRLLIITFVAWFLIVATRLWSIRKGSATHS